MSRYQLFILCFIISIVAGLAFLGAYFVHLADFVRMAQGGRFDNDPAAVFSALFSPVMVICLILACITSLAYRILGIIFIAGNNRLEGGEKAIWIIGFILVGFIAAIVFMALASSRNLLGQTGQEYQKL